MPVRLEEYQALVGSLKHLRATYEEVINIGIELKKCQGTDVPKWMNSRHRLLSRGQEITELLVCYFTNAQWMESLSVSQAAWVSEFRKNIVEMEPTILRQHHEIILTIRKKSQGLRNNLVSQNKHHRAINAYINAPGSRTVAG